MKTRRHRGALGRRQFLAAGIGTAVALPLLEWHLGSQGALAQASVAHTRFVCFYLPNGVIQNQWWPQSGSGASFDLSGTALAPLQQHKGALSIFKNLRNVGRSSGGGNAHMRAISAFLTGMPIPNDRITRHEISFDQALADHYAEVAPTPIHSLQLAGNNKIDPPNNASYNNNLKNALSFDHEGRILPTTANLRAVFDRAFQGVDASQATQDAKERAFLRRSVLDHVSRERASLNAKLGANDTLRLEQYFDSIRELERRLDAFDEMDGGGGQCGQDASAPKSYDDNRDNHFIGEHARLTANLMALLFQCELTRVATYMSSGEASKTEYPELDIHLKFHDAISHNQGAHRGKHHRIDTYHAELVAHFLDVFEATPHGAGTLLDGTCLLMGSGLGNGDAHSMDNIAMMMAGRFGSIQQGRFYEDMSGDDHSRLLNAISQEMNLPAGVFAGRQGDPINLS